MGMAPTFFSSYTIQNFYQTLMWNFVIAQFSGIILVELRLSNINKCITIKIIGK